MKFQAAALTHEGRQRERNEDTVFQKVLDLPGEEPTGLFVVADGVGGQLAGHIASYWAVETIKNSLADLIAHKDPRATNRFDKDELLRMQAAANGVNVDDLRERVAAAVDDANWTVYQYAQHKPDVARNAGSTVCMALAQGRQLVIANVGDSRAYILRNGRLHQITRDHSVVQRMVDAGQLEPDAVSTHPQRHLIYRSLGLSASVKPDILTLELADGDYLLLCTDGLWEMVPNTGMIARIIRTAPSVEVACQRLVDTANAAGGHDNIGVVLVHVSA